MNHKSSYVPGPFDRENLFICKSAWGQARKAILKFMRAAPRLICDLEAICSADSHRYSPRDHLTAALLMWTRLTAEQRHDGLREEAIFWSRLHTADQNLKQFAVPTRWHDEDDSPVVYLDIDHRGVLQAIVIHRTRLYTTGDLQGLIEAAVSGHNQSRADRDEFNDIMLRIGFDGSEAA